MRRLLSLLLLMCSSAAALPPLTRGLFASSPSIAHLLHEPSFTSLGVGLDAAPGSEDAPKTGLSKAKDFADTVHSVFTVLAIVVGGFWTYMLFIKKRQRYPRAKATHAITHKPLGHNRVLLHVTTDISNPGEVLLRLESGFTRVQQLLPPPPDLVAAIKKGDDPVPPGKTEYPWPLVGERIWDWKAQPHEVEPGENEEVHCDFVIADTHRTLEIYTYVKNEAKANREIGWNLTTIYDLKEGS
ncbi:MAG TPA: hypothetical protein VMH48_09410 [Methylomirabilota bacterium]|nr:hypothetical protein [Methylomirabilota bacterium]